MELPEGQLSNALLAQKSPGDRSRSFQRVEDNAFHLLTDRDSPLCSESGNRLILRRIVLTESFLGAVFH